MITNTPPIELYRTARKDCLAPASEQDIKRTRPYTHTQPNANNRTGLLFIHGYTSTPHSMRPLADALQDEVHFTSVPLLAGHGTNPIDMGQSTYQDWYQSIKTAYLEMKKCCDKVIVIGQSLGALLATLLAHEFPEIEQVIMLVPAFYPPAIINLTPVISPLLNALQIKTLHSVGGNIKKPGGFEIAYKRIHVKAPRELYRCCLLARQQLPALRQPILVIGSKHDQVLNCTGIQRAFDAIQSTQKELIWVTNSYHVASLDNDAMQIIELIRKQLS